MRTADIAAEAQAAATCSQRHPTTLPRPEAGDFPGNPAACATLRSTWTKGSPATAPGAANSGDQASATIPSGDPLPRWPLGMGTALQNPRGTRVIGWASFIAEPAIPSQA